MRPLLLPASLAFFSCSRPSIEIQADASIVQIQIACASSEIPQDLSVPCEAIGLYSDGHSENITTLSDWSSQNENILEVRRQFSGWIEGVSPGASKVVVSAGKVSASFDVTVTNVSPISLDITPSNATYKTNTNVQYTAYCTYSDGSVFDVTKSAFWSSSDTTVALIGNGISAGGSVETQTPGNTTIEVQYSGLSSQTNLQVKDKQLLLIKIVPSSSTLQQGLTRNFTATGIYSDTSQQDLTQTVSWSSGDTSVATVNNSNPNKGLVSALGAGSTQIFVNYDGVSNSSDISVTNSVLQSITVTPGDSTVSSGQTEQMTATANYEDGSSADVTTSVSWASTDTNVATVSNVSGNKGLASAIALGTTTINATLNGTTGQTNLTVTSAALVSITVTPAGVAIPRGMNQQLIATGNYSDGSTSDLTETAAWTSTNSVNISVSNSSGTKGLANATGSVNSTSTIRAKVGSLQGQTNASVIAPVISSIAVAPASSSLAKGLTQQFTATAMYSDGTLTDVTSSAVWASSNTAVTTISNLSGSKGRASAVDFGTTNISATVSGVVGQTDFNVVAATLSSIAVTPNAPSVARGTILNLIATATYTDGTTADVTASANWNSANSSIVSVGNSGGNKGLTTALGAVSSSASISAMIGSVTGQTTVTVAAPALTSIAVTPANAPISNGTSQAMTATGTYSDSSTSDLTSTATWSSSDTSVATVSNASGSKGHVTGVSVGSSTIKATVGAIHGQTNVNIVSATLTSIAVTPNGPSVPRGTTLGLTATGTYSDGSSADITTSATWSSGNSGNVSVSNSGGAKGTVTASGTVSSSAVISATIGSITGQTNVTVGAAVLSSIVVTPGNSPVAKGTTQQFAATGTYSDSTTADLTSTAIWASSDTSTATISNVSGSKGRASALAQGSSTITATIGSIVGQTYINVVAATLTSIAVTPSGSNIPRGMTLSLAATGTYTDGSTADVTNSSTWVSSNMSNLSVNSIGAVTAVGAVNTTANISATIGGVSGQVTATVLAPVLSSIAVTPSNSSLAKGLSRQFIAVGTYSDSTTSDLTSTAAWASTDSSIASVSNVSGSKGLASALNIGSITVSATVESVTGQTVLDVVAATLSSISVSPSAPNVPRGTTQAMIATGTYSDGSTSDVTASATWGSSNSSNLSVNSSGTVTASGAINSTANIIATIGSVSGQTNAKVIAPLLSQITVTPTNSSLAKGLTRQFTATGTYTDSTTADITSSATWTSGDTSVATVSSASGSKGLGSGVDIGSTAIIATVASVSGQTNLDVVAAMLSSIAVTPSGPAVPRGTTLGLTATGTYSDGTTADVTSGATWSSNNTGNVSVSDASGIKGIVTANGAVSSSAAISATVGSVIGQTTVVVAAPILSSIAVTPTNAPVAKGTTQQYTATGTYSDGSTVNITASTTWASTDTSIATINSSGLATAVAIGSSTITATVGSVAGQTNMNVVAAVLTSIAVTPSNPSVPKGTTLALTATGTYSDGSTADVSSSATWASSNSSNLSVNSSGVVSAVGTVASSANISATIGSISGQTTPVVAGAILSSIAVTPSNPAIAKGLTQQFTATGTYSDSTTTDVTTSATWTSSDTGKATVSDVSGSKGFATAVAVGSANIIATVGSVSSQTTLTINPATLISIAISPNGPAVPLGTTQALTATGTYTDGSTSNLTNSSTWASSNSSNVTVASSGVVSPVGAIGSTANITATVGSIVGQTTVTVAAPTLTSIAVTPANPSVAKGLTQQFTATGTYSDSSTGDITSSVTWASSNTSNATISNVAGSKGLSTTLGIGSTTITANSGSVSGNTTLTITAAVIASIEIAPSGPSVPRGTTLGLTATATYTDGTNSNVTSTATWASSNASNISVNSSGVVNAVGAVSSAANITASQSGVTGQTTVTVATPNLVSLAVTPTNPSVVHGLTQQFTATGTYSDGSTQNDTSTVTWASGTTSVATISGSGLGTSVAESGTSLITATKSGVTGSTTLTATPALIASIAVTPTGPAVPRGTTQAMTAIATYTDSTTLDVTTTATWVSGTPGNITVNSSGVVTASPGVQGSTAVISATKNGITGQTTATVAAPNLVSIAVTPTNPSVIHGLAQQFTATGTYSDSTTQNITSTVTWTSVTTSVATINSSGLATSVAETGTSLIRATLSGITGSTTLTATPAQIVSITVTPANAVIHTLATLQYTATATMTDGTTPILANSSITWFSTNTQAATIDSNGLATAAVNYLSPNTTIRATSKAPAVPVGIVGETQLTLSP